MCRCRRLAFATALLFLVTGSAIAAGWLPADAPSPPGSTWLTTSLLPGYEFQVRIGGSRIGAAESDCLAETLCVSGAIPGRSEVFVRVVGPKPNGYLWPNVVKFSTSEIEVWIRQISSGQLRYYDLPASDPDAGVLAGSFDRTGFLPASAFASGGWELAAGERPRSWLASEWPHPATSGGPAPPSSTWLTTTALPGFRFQVRIGGTRLGVKESDCLAETLCVSGAVPGRSEVFVRVVGPKPNGYLWPNVVKFSTSEIEVWAEQTASGDRQYYDLPAADPNGGVLAGLFDRLGFRPPSSPPALDARYLTPLTGTWHFTNGLDIAVAGTDGAYTNLEMRFDGIPRQQEFVASLSSGLVSNREHVWVDPNDYTQTGLANTPGYVPSDHLWAAPYMVFPYGLEVGSSFSEEKDEEIVVPLGNDGVVAHGCAVAHWTDWKYVHQTQTTTVLAQEVLTVPAGTFTTLKVRVRVLETNNPFNPCGEVSDHWSDYWFAKGIGFVKLSLGPSNTFELEQRVP